MFTRRHTGMLTRGHTGMLTRGHTGMLTRGHTGMLLCYSSYSRACALFTHALLANAFVDRTLITHASGDVSNYLDLRICITNIFMRLLDRGRPVQILGTNLGIG